MQILQLSMKSSWIGRSSNPAQSMQAAVVMANSFIDDQGMFPQYGPLEIGHIDNDQTLMLFAKDMETMQRGLRKATSKGIRLPQGIKLAVAASIWNLGTVRHTSKAAAAVLTITHNIRTYIMRDDRLQSVKANVRAVSRDGKLLQRGCGVYVAPADSMPRFNPYAQNSFEWYGGPGSLIGFCSSFEELGNHVHRILR